MSLETWLANGWLLRFELSDQEAAELISAAQQDLRDANQDLSPSWRFAIAYNAALRLCSVALGKAGYRAAREQKHYRTVAALPFVIGPEAAELASFLDTCRAKRHAVTYEALRIVSQEEAKELIDAVEELMQLVRRRFKL